MPEWLTDPLGFDFFRRALGMALLTGLLCPVVGSWLVVQRLGFLANVISHSVLPGVVIAGALGWDLSIGAFLSGLASTLVLNGIEWLQVIRPEAAMNAVLASFFALGVLLVPVLHSRLNLEAFLFGDLLSVTPGDLWRTGAIALLLLGLITCFYRPLLYYSFDPAGAQALGLPVGRIRLAMTGAITLTIIAGMQSVGVILIIAMIACPALAAYLLVRELHEMLLVSALLGMLAAVGGLFLSYWANLPSGATISLVAFGVFLLALVFSPRKGVWRRSAARTAG